MWSAKGFLLGLRQTCIKLWEANIAPRPGETHWLAWPPWSCPQRSHIHRQTNTHAHSGREKHKNNYSCQKQTASFSRKNVWQYRLAISLCIKNAEMHRESLHSELYLQMMDLLNGLECSVGTNVLNTSVWSMGLSGTAFKCIILSREAQKTVRCPPAKSAVSREHAWGSDSMAAKSLSPSDCRTHQWDHMLI